MMFIAMGRVRRKGWRVSTEGLGSRVEGLGRHMFIGCWYGEPHGVANVNRGVRGQTACFHWPWMGEAAGDGFIVCRLQQLSVGQGLTFNHYSTEASCLLHFYFSLSHFGVTMPATHAYSSQ